MIAAHLALGMLAPICLVQAAPVSLVLRALPPATARRLVRRLERRGPRLLAHPITAATLDIGGLWLLFATPLFPLMQRRAWLAALIDLHMLLAGYLVTAALIGLDPIRRRPAWLARAAVLVLALGAHATLAKHLYAHPPAGVDAAQARAGAKLMYYGGDLVDALLIALFCRQWRRGARPGNDAGFARNPRRASTGRSGAQAR
jgi:putative membrane protein